VSALHQGRRGRPWRRLTQQLKAMGQPCWLCGQHIDTTLPRTHPMSWTADHVVPRSKGGAPTLDNIRACHRSCNSKRGNKTKWPTLRTSREW
jgi:5-methylcytosine-specific restriction endonuclease McrA